MKLMSLQKSKVVDVTTAINKFYCDSHDEVTIPKKLVVSGQIPEFLTGIYLKNGPACFGDLHDTSGYEYDHIFDGLAKLSKYEFKQTFDHYNEEKNTISVYYSTKFMKSKLHNEMLLKKKKLPLHISVGPIIPKDPKPSLSSFLDKFKIFLTDNDNTNVNIVRIGETGPWACTTDASVSYNDVMQCIHYFE